MALVGDVIVRCRTAAGDPPQTIAQPFAPALTIGGVGALNGVIFGVLTWLNNFGETVGSTEVSISGLANNAITLTSNPPVGATSGRFYYSTFSGREEHFATLGVTGTDVVGTVGQAQLPGVPPYKPSAYYPDSDGDQISAYEMYRWLNAGLTEMGRLTGGILDQTGVAMPGGNAEVIIPGWWLSIKYVWHNGWLTLAENQSYTWRQSPVGGIPGIVTLWRNGASQVLGTWPQPSAGPATTSLTAPMLATDATAVVVSNSGFIAPGMCLIDNEQMSYSNGGTDSTTLGGLTRGYAGTVPAAHAIGATVTQLILLLLGRRMPVIQNVGDANVTLDLPRDWDQVLDDYIMSRFAMVAGDKPNSMALLSQFRSRCRELRDDSIPLEVKQVGGLYPLGDATQTLASVMDAVIIN